MAGTSVDISLYPIDTLKTRLQSKSGFKNSGGFRGIYAGVGSAFVGSAPGAALFFVTYDSCKRLLKEHREAQARLRFLSGQSNNGILATMLCTEPLEHMAAASVGEIAACAVRVPTEVVKQRAQALQHPSSFSAFRHILAQRHEKGLLGIWKELYRGWTITIMREVPFTIIQFPLWEALKSWRRIKFGQDHVSGIESAAYGSLSGAVAAAITTPLDVLKTRMMLATDKQRMIPLLTRIMAESGPAAFFSGIGPRVLWISAGGAIFLGSYQWTINALGGDL